MHIMIIMIAQFGRFYYNLLGQWLHDAHDHESFHSLSQKLL